MKLKRIDITKFCLISTLLVVSSTSLLAQTSVKTLDTKSKSEEAIKWSGEFGTTYSSNLYKSGSTVKSTGADFDATVAATINKTKYSLNATATKALTGERQLDLNNAYLGAARSLYRFDDQWSLSGTARLTIPLSEASKDYQRQITGVSLAPKLTWKSDFGLTAAYSASGLVNFHKYETSLTGASNYQYIVGNALALTYEFGSGMYVYANATYSKLITYQGNTKDSYRFIQMVGSPIAENVDFGLGHIIGGSPLAANGIETDIRFFDSRDSTVFGMLTLSF
ncbi:MAG: hypothetical protein COW01_02390 [Bdellovibrionales bacterium CG12_big_fil_rev_8_21_14_0_65_38_15]|nr:MAG: hypothetical protein COW79_08055 [Bdellovibrionales bacterium CG22_combo_CG10-13_8_21_14_all_38_13]PIQ56942.1 MAG: hypothetical protein COW01_02390 [Bdellovibrionales bacterium CG12_big_fil_rev_8_21_14_0_65_38_15]PIR29097.1 MAG: hypothetical protein COV38_12730 [Bdellovibrionales bacterium CG11_big_fil_rev_8_21_14_0_20_38_13]